LAFVNNGSRNRVRQNAGEVQITGKKRVLAIGCRTRFAQRTKSTTDFTDNTDMKKLTGFSLIRVFLRAGKNDTNRAVHEVSGLLGARLLH